MRNLPHPYLVLILIFTLLPAACSPEAQLPTAQDRRPNIVATTTIISDVIQQIAGEQVSLYTLLPVDADPHSFEPTPQDVTRIADADIVFANGLGLETFLDKLIANAGSHTQVVYLSTGIQARVVTASNDEHNPAGEGEDPHVWTDPNNVSIWVDNIVDALVAADPQNAAIYQANARSYQAELRELDNWIRERIRQVPPEKRTIVTDHLVLGYFADTYGFKQVGAVVPGFSPLSQPSAKELAQIENAIRELQVPAILVGTTVNPSLAQNVAQDTGTRLVPIYTGSLSGTGGDAPHYIEYIHYNVNAIVDALR